MTTSAPEPADYHALNAMLNLFDKDGKMQLDKDKEAAREYFLQHVNQNTVFFHTLREKIDYLIENKYYEAELFEKYQFDLVKELFQKAYAHKFRFPTFLGAFKFYTGYALKTFDGTRYLERYEDRVCVTALYLGRGNILEAVAFMEEMITGRYQPATPTFLNAGKKQRGELVSCFLLDVADNMESIARAITSSLQLSKRGGGVALSLSNLRESGAPIKNIEGQASGVIPVMKMLEDAFSYANQLGARQGAGAVYLSAHHPDIMKFLDTKRENADEKIRIKTLSLGVVIPDIAFELARENRTMHLFSPYDVEREYGVEFSKVGITEKYYEMVNNKRIRKTTIKARDFFQTLAELQFESGYPYIVFEDTVNRANPIAGHINMSNLCTEILQVSTPSTYSSNSYYETVGEDISCNLGSLNIAKAMDGKDIRKTVNNAIRMLSAVSDLSDISCVPSIQLGNATGHAVGLGQMNLHGFLAREHIHYDSPEAIEFVHAYFSTITFHALWTSATIAAESKIVFDGFEDSKYYSGEFFEKYKTKSYRPLSPKIILMLERFNFHVPSPAEWAQLEEYVRKHGLYNRYLQAIPPTGSISYINNSTASIHPITAKIEIRKEGKVGRAYYPAPYLTEENKEFYKDAYEIGPDALIDIYAAATEHVDQGLSMTMFFKDTATTRDINRAQIKAWKAGIKTIYYIRLRQMALSGTEVAGCVSCAL